MVLIPKNALLLMAFETFPQFFAKKLLFLTIFGEILRVSTALYLPVEQILHLHNPYAGRQ